MSAKFKGLLLLAGFTAVSFVLLNSTGNKASAAACTAPTTDYGTVTQTVNIPSAGSYRVWSRIMAPDATNNSYLLEVTDGSTVTCFKVGDSAITANTWTWVDYQNATSTNKINATFASAGNKTIKMIGNEPSVKLDRVIFTGDTNCVPNNTKTATVNPGDNCANPPDTTFPNVAITTPSGSGTTVPASTNIVVTATDDVAIQTVQLFDGTTAIGGTKTGTPGVNTYSFAVTLAAGTHSLTAKATDTSNNPTTSAVVTVVVADTTAPIVSGVSVSSITQTSAVISWTTNDASDTQVKYGTTTAYGSTTTLNTNLVTSHSASLTGLTAGTLYHYQAVSKDAAGNAGTSADGTFTTTAVTPTDTTKPVVTMTAPANGTTQSGTNVTISANATDNSGTVSGVQFLVDGQPVGPEDTSSPFSIIWNTTVFTNGTHVLSAIARDPSGNTNTPTATISVTVNNVTYRPEDINKDTVVDFKDLGLFIAKYNQSVTNDRSDINGDGVVNFRDLGLLISQYGK